MRHILVNSVDEEGPTEKSEKLAEGLLAQIRAGEVPLEVPLRSTSPNDQYSDLASIFDILLYWYFVLSSPLFSVDIHEYFSTFQTIKC